MARGFLVFGSPPALPGRVEGPSLGFAPLGMSGRANTPELLAALGARSVSGSAAARESIRREGLAERLEDLTDANKNLAVRIASAVLLLPIVLWLLWRGERTTAVLVAAVAAILAFEFYRIVFRKLDAGQIFGVAAAALIPLAYGFWPHRFGAIVTAAAMALLMGLFAYYLVAGPLPEAPARVSFGFTGIFYCGLLLSAVVGLRRMHHGFEWILLTLTVTWVNDTGAYAAGRAFGRHKLYPQVSPGKTWEGFAGGMVGALVGALVAKAAVFPDLQLADCLLVALPTSVLGPLGDLSESMLKRAYGVKDSGKIMPGHGGLLDRVDALLFTAPYVFLYALSTRG